MKLVEHKSRNRLEKRLLSADKKRGSQSGETRSSSAGRNSPALGPFRAVPEQRVRGSGGSGGRMIGSLIETRADRHTVRLFAFSRIKVKVRVIDDEKTLNPGSSGLLYSQTPPRAPLSALHCTNNQWEPTESNPNGALLRETQNGTGGQPVRMGNAATHASRALRTRGTPWAVRV